MEYKPCFKCERVLPLEEFYRHPQMADGHLNKCRDCTRADVKASYRKAYGARQRYERIRSASPKRKRWRTKYQAEWRSKNPDKYRAYMAVSNALRSGRLVRQPCERCGKRAQAHHADYSKPLDVRWLCVVCHRVFEHADQYAVLASNVRGKT